MLRALRTPVATFLLVATIVVSTMVLISTYVAGQAAEDVAIAGQTDTNRLIARSVIEPFIRQGLVEGRPSAYDRIDRRAIKLLLVGDIHTVNIWDADGRLIYSDDVQLVGQTFRLSAGQREVLARGGTGWEIADPSSPRNAASSDEKVVGLVQIYTQMRSRNGEPLLFEAYYKLDQIKDRRSEILSTFRWITLAPLFVLTLVVTVMLQLLTRQIRRAGRERERLLRTAIDASDAERRRIARDLHDGVVQDLAGTTFALSGLARDPQTTERGRGVLDAAGSSLRDSLKALRSLLAEIHPPDLHAQGLPAALSDLIAPTAAAGIQTSVSIEGLDRADDAQVALVWRVAQEAVRNAVRHSRASTLAVTVRGDDAGLSLEIVDDGIGFDPAAAAPDRFGLRGLRSLVADVGGDLEVVSAVGEGTTVRMTVAKQ